MTEVFFLAMSLYPEVQQKAQSEIMEVVGRDRLPEITDRDTLIYVNALVKECLRWMPIAPLGVAHTTTVDDEFRGYFIPKNTVLLPNIWYDSNSHDFQYSVPSLTLNHRACMHDPEVFEHPEEFRPERFIHNGKLNPGPVDPSDYVFGFGRR